jgi:hypothetical protein
MKTTIVDWKTLAGSAALIAVIAAVTAVQAQQAQRLKGGYVQKGREAWSVASQQACEAGTARACRAIEAAVTAGAWTWTDGDVTAVDIWDSRSQRRAPSSDASAPGAARGHHIPRAVIVQRVLAACDAGDVTACQAFAGSVRPAA